MHANGLKKRQTIKIDNTKIRMYINLFKTFFKIGIVTFGGGYAMIPMIEEDVVRRNKWVSKDEFIDLLAIALSRRLCNQHQHLYWLQNQEDSRCNLHSLGSYPTLFYHHSSHCDVLPSVSKQFGCCCDVCRHSPCCGGLNSSTNIYFG